MMSADSKVLREFPMSVPPTRSVGATAVFGRTGILPVSGNSAKGGFQTRPYRQSCYNLGLSRYFQTISYACPSNRPAVTRRAETTLAIIIDSYLKKLMF